MQMKPNVTFEMICSSKVNAFYLFTHLKDTIKEFEKSDVQQLYQQQLKYSTKATNWFLLTVVCAQVVTLVLKQRNVIFQMTYNLSMWGLFKKYYLVPTLIMYPFRTQWENEFDKIRSGIVDKYDYAQPQFEAAFKKVKESGSEMMFLNDSELQKYLEGSTEKEV